MRDGRAFCCSYLKNRNLSNEYIEEAANVWTSYIKQVDDFASDFPFIDIVTIRYEDLCNKPEETMRNACGFLDFNFESTMNDAPVEHHMFGNRMRSEFDGKIKEDLSWKDKLNVEEVEKLNQLLENNLIRYDYLS